MLEVSHYNACDAACPGPQFAAMFLVSIHLHAHLSSFLSVSTYMLILAHLLSQTTKYHFVTLAMLKFLLTGLI